MSSHGYCDDGDDAQSNYNEYDTISTGQRTTSRTRKTIFPSAHREPKIKKNPRET